MNNRFCRCCFSDHNADGTICRGFLSHLSDNKHSLSSQRSGKRPPVPAWGSPLEPGSPGEEPPERRTGPRQLGPAHGEARPAGSDFCAWDLLESPAETQPSRGSIASTGEEQRPAREYWEAPKDLCHLYHSECEHRSGVTMTRST